MKQLKLSAMHHRGIEVLSREQMKNVLGKMVGGSGDLGHQYMGCNYDEGSGGLTCDYQLTRANGETYDLCGAECLPGDGHGCLPE
jgi:hypothetical protein